MDECENRSAVIDGKKCFCIAWGKWTNCLEVGHCVRESEDSGNTENEEEPDD